MSAPWTEPIKPEDAVRGKQIVYIPSHADGNPGHPDSEFGFITSSGRVNALEGGDAVFCRYFFNGKAGKIRTTANSESTNLRDLYPCESVPQFVVEALLWLIEKDRL